ncbi:MAG: PhoX family phosphatase, partial [Niveispirillum sp.]|nr:PhoX family phosphatase [Niveispirillum sp.]
MSENRFLTHEEFEAIQDKGASPDSEPTFGEVVQARLGRRDILRGMLGTSAIAAFAPAVPVALIAGEAKAQAASAAGKQAGFGFNFEELTRGIDAKHHVAPGYDADVLIRWGDPLFADSPDFDPYKQTADSQLKQFGYNCDFTAFYPLPQGSSSADHGLLWVNHEYTQAEMMFPGLAPEGQDKYPPESVTKEMVDIEMAAHSGSIVEVRRGKDGKWAYVKGGKFNRRINALNTKMSFTGPAAGHARMKTKDDPEGRTVIGMLNNCAGGVTPWGTVLSGEENIDGYFMGTIDQTHPEQRNYDRMTVPSPWYQWGRFHERFHINKEPYGANRYGWIVEIDPYDPTSTPRKLTALGRFKHEGAGVTLNKDGRAVVYMGDDQRFEHVYRFVSKSKYDPADRKANMKLLDEGTLSVARFDADGTVTWLPLVQGQGPLTPANGFKDQGDVVIAARIAATLVGATRMDRPEDVEVNPKTGLVYVMLTNNDDRLPDDPIHPTQIRPNAANPRPANSWGHIVEMVPPGGDHAAQKFTWEILVKAGNPADPKTGASFNKATTENGWFSCPDNCAFDSMGRLWVGTDQGSKWQWTSGSSDGIWAMETQGPLRGTARLFFRVPVGAEL